MVGGRSLPERPSSSSIKPFEAKPETISTPSNVDGAEAGNIVPGKTPALIETSAAAEMDAAFTNTKQHVADRQKALVVTERFTNTKQNIALINDPKNGPRFTLTKKESGHVETSEAKSELLSTDKSVSNAASKAKTTEKQESEKSAERETAETAVLSPSKPAPASNDDVDWLTDGDVQQTAASTLKEQPAGPLGVPPAAIPPDKVPIDSSKTFVGPNGTFYDEAWRWMDWRGATRSWNWSAALSFGHWFAYRRLYGYASAFVVWLTCLTAALVNSLHVGIAAGLLILSLVLVGLYANTFYLLVFKKAVAEVTEKGDGSYDDLRQQLAEAGGVNFKAPWCMACLTILGIGLALGLTFFNRGGLLINIWPF